MALRAAKCKLLETDARNVIYSSTVRVIPPERLHMDEALLSLFRKDFIKWFQEQLTTLSLFKPYPTNYSIHLCDVELYQGYTNNCTQPIGRCKDTSRKQYLVFAFKIQVDEWHSFDAVFQFMSCFTSKTFHMILFTSELTYRFYDFKIEAASLILESAQSLSFVTSNDIINSCKESFTRLDLGQFKSCPLIILNASEHKWFSEIFLVYFPDLNLKVNASQFHYDVSDSAFYICADAYIEACTFVSGHYYSTYPETEQLLSLICISISLISLLLSLGTYVVLPSLRNIPGKNNMALTSSLMTAQILYLIGNYGRLEQDSLECKTVGLLTHLFWLLSVLWMGVCTFHIFRKFSTLSRSISIDNWKTFLTYVCITLVISSISVIANILGSLYLSDISEFGYGKYICYITSSKMTDFTFAAPVGIVVVSNMCLFIRFIYKIRKLPDLKKDIKNERNYILVFAKLSTLTGITWVFGYIYVWSRVKVFSYLFIILNASQGIFLCISFVINKRVLYMLKSRFGMLEPSESFPESFRRRTTISYISSTKGKHF